MQVDSKYLPKWFLSLILQPNIEKQANSEDYKNFTVYLTICSCSAIVFLVLGSFCLPFPKAVPLRKPDKSQQKVAKNAVNINQNQAYLGRLLVNM